MFSGMHDKSIVRSGRMIIVAKLKGIFSLPPLL